jgi:hypothetical protein
VGDFDDAMSGLRSAIASAQKMKSKQAPGALSGAKPKELKMSESTSGTETTSATEQQTAAAPVAASLKDLKTKFPKSTADWREKAMEDGLTLAQASERWMTHLEEANAKLADDLAQSKAAAKPIGAKPIATETEREAGHDAGGGGDPKAALNAIADAYVKGGMKREKAFARACKENEALASAWRESHTSTFGQAVQRGYRA